MFVFSESLWLATDDMKQTLRFVQSLPKRERQPLSNKFRNADPLGTITSPHTEMVTDLIQPSISLRKCSYSILGSGCVREKLSRMNILLHTMMQAMSQWRMRNSTGLSTTLTYQLISGKSVSSNAAHENNMLTVVR